MDVIVTGSLAFDQIMDFPQSFEKHILPEKLKALSVSFLAENFSKNFGGVAGNISYNLALLGQKAVVLSSAGKKDFFSYRKHLQKAGVETAYVRELAGEFTANMFIITDRNNCQIAGFYPGAMEEDQSLSIKTVFTKGKPRFVVVAPTMPKAMNNFVKEAKKLTLPYLFDPAQQIPRLSRKQLKEGIKGAEILIGNDYELALIGKKTGLAKKEILAQVKVLVTTLGEKGSVVETKNQKWLIGVARPENVVDPTGAGDGYIAGFLAGYVGKHPLDICGQIGATVATYAIEQYGTQKHRFTLQQFKKRYRKAFSKHLPGAPQAQHHPEGEHGQSLDF
ncbi:MAG: carbohydrate kinase family protein [bacterium]|nr:carbohydrate kinase family protein [bacterium]